MMNMYHLYLIVQMLLQQEINNWKNFRNSSKTIARKNARGFQYFSAFCVVNLASTINHQVDYVSWLSWIAMSWRLSATFWGPATFHQSLFTQAKRRKTNKVLRASFINFWLNWFKQHRTHGHKGDSFEPPNI